MPGAYLDRIKKTPNALGVRLKGRKSGADIVEMADGSTYELPRQAVDPIAKLTELERMGFDSAVLSPPLTISHYELEGRPMRDHCRSVNDDLASIQTVYSPQLFAMGLLPMQDSAFAVQEVRRLANAGFKAVIMCSNIKGRNLDDEAFRPIFRELAEVRMLVFIHPWFVAGAERLQRYYLANAVGNPFEASIAAASLILSGILDDISDLRVCIGHGGGALALIIGRINRASKIGKAADAAIDASPGSYLRRLWYDSIVHSDRGLEFLLTTVGADRVLAGNDCPFHLVDMGDPEPIARVHRLRISQRQKELIQGETAKHLLSL